MEIKATAIKEEFGHDFCGYEFGNIKNNILVQKKHFNFRKYKQKFDRTIHNVYTNK